MRRDLRNREKHCNFATLFGAMPRSIEGDSLAQLVEHNTFNVGVLGSSPRRITQDEDASAMLVRLIVLCATAAGIAHYLKIAKQLVRGGFDLP